MSPEHEEQNQKAPQTTMQTQSGAAGGPRPGRRAWESVKAYRFLNRRRWWWWWFQHYEKTHSFSSDSLENPREDEKGFSRDVHRGEERRGREEEKRKESAKK